MRIDAAGNRVARPIDREMANDASVIVIAFGPHLDCIVLRLSAQNVAAPRHLDSRVIGDGQREFQDSHGSSAVEAGR